MTIEQQIIWLAWFRRSDCEELFEIVTGDQFPTKDLGKIYDFLKEKKLSFKSEEFEKTLYTLEKNGILDQHSSWVPLMPQRLKEALIEEWHQKRGGQILDKAFQELQCGGDYRKTLKEFEKIEAEHQKKQSTLSDHFEAIAEEHVKGTSKGIPTGIESVDEMTQQLKAGHLWVIAAYTNTGKTTLTLQMARNALRNGAKVDFISLEMSARQLLTRLTWIEASTCRTKFENAIANLIDLPLTVTENLRTVEEIKSHIEASNADLIIIDYIQLIRGGKSYFDAATLAANMMQEMAIKKMISIITLSQVTKDSAKQGVSQHMDFKNSGAIAESADVAIEIYRQKENEAEVSEALLAIKKNRHGRTGSCTVEFDSKRGIFRF